VQGTFIRDTIADVDALDISDGDRRRIYEGNARELLGVHAHAA
jgi:predicted TIM-barrel fold metal-dependent hydrolase